MQITNINSTSLEGRTHTEDDIVSFLHSHLDEYGDSKSDILKAINYASNSGFILVGHYRENIVACVVVNETGMSGYIPENILVYIAVHRLHRGEGVGKEILKETIEACNGNIALHVEKDNPARFLYEKMGFTNPYLEMRLIKN